MTSDAIYLISDSGELRRIEHQRYASEDILQELVAKHPDVLAGDQIDPEAPPRWATMHRLCPALLPENFCCRTAVLRWNHVCVRTQGMPTPWQRRRVLASVRSPKNFSFN